MTILELTPTANIFFRVPEQAAANILVSFITTIIMFR
jgi:hypothetical protein